MTVNRLQSATLMVDTGATTTLLRPLVLNRLAVSLGEAPRRRMFVVGGRSVEVALIKLALEVGSATVDNLEAGVADVFPGAHDVDGLLEADFFRRFKMVLETTARRMTLEPLAP